MDKVKNRGILMNNNQEKALMKINEKSIFYKIKKFLRNLFKKQEIEVITSEAISNNEPTNDIQKQKFLENIRNIENEETILLKLQKQYRNGEIKEEDLTETQYKSLCDLYDNQIAKLKKSNEIRKQKILQYKNKLQSEG